MSAETNGPEWVDVFVARRLGRPASWPVTAQTGTDCFRLHRVQWQETCMSEDGKQLICRFRAPDAESVRLALRLSGIDFERVWT